MARDGKVALQEAEMAADKARVAVNTLTTDVVAQQAFGLVIAQRKPDDTIKLLKEQLNGSADIGTGQLALLQQAQFQVAELKGQATQLQAQLDDYTQPRRRARPTILGTPRKDQ